MGTAPRIATGPTTPLGKSKMRDNPLKHGLTAKYVVTKGEAVEDYEALRSGLMESYLPSTPAEAILVTQIAEGYWRLMRARKVETAFWDRHVVFNPGECPEPVPGQVNPSQPSSYEEAMLRTLVKDGAEFDRINRYVTTLERAYYRAVKELQKEQVLRRERLAENVVQSVDSPLAATAPPENQAQSVSQNAQRYSSAQPSAAAAGVNAP